LIWDDIIADLKGKTHSEPVLTALERLRVA
jgi:hypothetical protein